MGHPPLLASRRELASLWTFINRPKGAAAQVAYIITNACIDVQDQSCIAVCPVDCIHFEEGRDRMCYVHPDECIDCAACESACPVGAIFAEGRAPAEAAEFIAINAQWFQDKAAARARVREEAGRGLSVT